MAGKKKFTNKNLSQVYLALEKKSQDLANKGLSSKDIFDELYTILFTELNADRFGGSLGLYLLLPDEHEKVYQVFDTFVAAKFNTVTDRADIGFDTNFVNFRRRRPEPVNWSSSSNYDERYYFRSYPYYYPRTTVWDYLIMHDLMAQVHSEPMSDQDKAFAMLFALMVLVVALAIYMSYFLILQVSDNLERLRYNEGMLHASISLMSKAAGGALGAMLTYSLFGNAFIGLVLTAGISNPIGLLLLLSGCIGVISASLAGAIAEYSIESANINNEFSESLDSSDPMRYQLTEQESAVLIMKGIDPTAVKCAIVALRQAVNETGRLSTSFFGKRTPQEQTCIDQVRQLRRGEISKVTTANGLVFDCEELIKMAEATDLSEENVTWAESAHCEHVPSNIEPSAPLGYN